MLHFYKEELRFTTIEQWERKNAKGIRLKKDNFILEIMDNQMKKKPLKLYEVGDRFHIVIEVNDIHEEYEKVKHLTNAPPQETSWKATLFQVKDPDNIPITYLKWLK